MPLFHKNPPAILGLIILCSYVSVKEADAWWKENKVVTGYRMGVIKEISPCKKYVSVLWQGDDCPKWAKYSHINIKEVWKKQEVKINVH